MVSWLILNESAPMMHVMKHERYLLPGPQLLSPVLDLLAVLLVQLLQLLGLVFNQEVAFLIL